MTRRFSSTLFHKPPLWTKKTANEPARIIKPTATKIVLERYSKKLGTSEEDTADWRSLFIIEPLDRQSKQLLISSCYYDTPLDTLYDIPQATWDEFLYHLPNKEVLEILNISYYRHIWDSYNFCVDSVERNVDASDELMRKRASLISNHHFLLTLLNYDSLDGPSLLDSTLWSADQPKKNIKEQASELAHHIGLAQFNPNDLKKICPYYTKSFFKKFSHCDSDYALPIWIRLIDDYATTINNYGIETVDTKRVLDAIDWIPSSRTEPAQFDHATKIGRVFCQQMIGFHAPYHRNGRNGMRGRLFFNSKQQWQFYDCRTLEENNTVRSSNSRDYLQALFNDLILRIFLQHLHGDDHDAEAIIRDFEEWFFYLLTDTLSLDQLNSLQLRWHRNIPVIANKKPPLLGEGVTWQPIVPETTINNIIIRALTSEKALKEHEKIMKHCVGGYTEYAMKNDCDILEFVDQDGTRSTLELRHDQKGVFRISQHAGVQNENVVPEHTQAAKELMVMLNESKTIAINNERLHDPGIHLPPFPYDVHDLTIQERIYAAYRDTKTLPSKLLANDYASMLKKTGLDKLVYEHIAACTCEDDVQLVRKAMRR
jgi:PcfJ-like protein